jgi:hypothetical protein
VNANRQAEIDAGMPRKVQGVPAGMLLILQSDRRAARDFRPLYG